MSHVCMSVLFQQSSRPRYIQRSKSHDDPHADIHAPAGTVRGRIARQGARMVRSRSPSSSPVGTSKSRSGPISPPLKKGYSTDSPAEVTVTYMPGAASPPESAQSLKDDKTYFRYSFKKKSPTPESSKDKQSDSDSVKSPPAPVSLSPPTLDPLSPNSKNPISPLPEGPLSPTVSEPARSPVISPHSHFMSLASTEPRLSHNIFSPTNPFSSLSHDKYDKPKPLVTSPDKKAPKSLVQSRIQMFTMPDRKSATAEQKPHTVSHFPPPPIPPRQHEMPAKSTTEQDSGSSFASKFTSRHRQRPFSPPQKQRAINKLLHELPVSDSSAFHVPYPKLSPPGSTSGPSTPNNGQQATPHGPNALYHGQSSTSQGSGKSNPFLAKQHKSPEFEKAKTDGMKQTYVSRCSSDESLTEYTSLLKDDDKSSSRSSICIYFDGKDVPDTLV